MTPRIHARLKSLRGCCRRHNTNTYLDWHQVCHTRHMFTLTLTTSSGNLQPRPFHTFSNTQQQQTRTAYDQGLITDLFLYYRCCRTSATKTDRKIIPARRNKQHRYDARGTNFRVFRGKTQSRPSGSSASRGISSEKKKSEQKDTRPRRGNQPTSLPTTAGVRTIQNRLRLEYTE